MKWAGYAEPTWEPADALEDTAALAVYEEEGGYCDGLNPKEGSVLTEPAPNAIPTQIHPWGGFATRDVT